MTEPARPATAPAPQAVDDDGTYYWEGLRRGQLLLQRCGSCARHRVPTLASCPWCRGTDTEIVPANGQGRIYSWVTVHRPLTATWRHEVPYTVAVVDLAEGCRTIGRLLDNGRSPGAGKIVTVRFVDHDDWTELCFASEAETARR